MVGDGGGKLNPVHPPPSPGRSPCLGEESLVFLLLWWLLCQVSVVVSASTYRGFSSPSGGTWSFARTATLRKKSPPNILYAVNRSILSGYSVLKISMPLSYQDVFFFFFKSKNTHIYEGNIAICKLWSPICSTYSCCRNGSSSLQKSVVTSVFLLFFFLFNIIYSASNNRKNVSVIFTLSSRTMHVLSSFLYD